MINPKIALIILPALRFGGGECQPIEYRDDRRGAKGIKEKEQMGSSALMHKSFELCFIDGKGRWSKNQWTDGW